MAQIKIKNNRTGKVETIDSDVWEKNKRQYAHTFTVLKDPATPPEVKNLQRRQAAAKASGPAPKIDLNAAEESTTQDGKADE